MLIISMNGTNAAPVPIAHHHSAATSANTQPEIVNPIPKIETTRSTTATGGMGGICGGCPDMT